MGRALRPQIRGGTYHVMNRGNRKTVIFEADRDRRRFGRILVETVEECGVEILGGTQMKTHFHLVVQTPQGNVSEFMQRLEGRYAQYVNWHYNRVGHLFQGPFRAVVIENNIHLFTALWYVFANAIEAGYCDRFQDWPWSTYAATVGLKPALTYLSLSWLETLFPASSLDISQSLFRQCMEDPDPVVRYLQIVDPTTDVAVRSYVSARIRQMRERSGLGMSLMAISWLKLRASRRSVRRQ
jgi:REP element-mobilizing transposase RayT